MVSVATKVNQLGASRILVVGDVMLDRYWMGRVERISPEAPVPVVKVEDTTEALGGAGNVAKNISSLGGECALLGIVGDDADGHRVAALTESAGIIPHLVTDPTLATTVKLRVMARKQQLMRADFERAPAASARARLKCLFADLSTTYDAIVFSDYGKGALGGIAEFLAMSAGRTTLVDPKGRDFSRYRGATVVTPNREEFEQAVGRSMPLSELEAPAREWLDRYALGALLITLGDQGMALFAADGACVRVESQAQEVFDVSGAGDTVIAVMAMALNGGLGFADAVQLANGAAGVVVSRSGAAALSGAELEAAVSRQPGS